MWYEEVEKPVTERVIQFGEGNFLRAFADWIIQEMNEKAGFDASVVVVQPIEKGMCKVLQEQNGVYNLYKRGLQNGIPTVERHLVKSIARTVNPYTSYDRFLKLAFNPTTRFIISNTTEAGIAFNEQDTLEGGCQRSFPAKLTALLYQRFQVFGSQENKGFIMLPCELIDRNGDKLKKIVLKYTKLWNLGAGFEQWLHDQNVFCNTLVDSIVPGFPYDRLKEIHEELGYEDKCVVEGELFHLWVIEGPEWIKNEFPAQKAGLNVVFTRDMTPYRTRKVRILNGSHTLMAPVAYLCGIETVRETIEHPGISGFISQAIFNEIIPTINLPREEIREFAKEVLDRFRNPYIKHQLTSIMLNAVSKYVARVLPTVKDSLNQNGYLPSTLVFGLAALLYYYRGDRDGQRIDLTDEEFVLMLFEKRWKKYDGTPESLHQLVVRLFSESQVWGEDLNSIPGLTEKTTRYLNNMIEKGVRQALDELLCIGELTNNQ